METGSPVRGTSGGIGERALVVPDAVDQPPTVCALLEVMAQVATPAGSVIPYVKDTLVLSNGTLVPGNFLPAQVVTQETATIYPTSGMVGSEFEFNSTPPSSGGPVWGASIYFGNTPLLSYNVPLSATPGTYPVTICDYILDTTILVGTGTAYFTVTVPTLTFNPAEGNNSTVRFTVSDFPSDDNVSIYSPFLSFSFNNPNSLPSSIVVTTDSSGSATGSVTIFAWGNSGATPPGTYQVVAGDNAGGYGLNQPPPGYGQYNNFAVANFTLTNASTTTLTLNPTKGHANSEVDFSVSQFSPNTYFNIFFPSSGSSSINSFETDAEGSGYGTFTVPDVGTANYTVTAVDTTGKYAIAQFTVTPTSETVTIQSYYGTTVSVRHAGSSQWIELSDPTSYVWQEGDTIATETNTVVQVDLGSHGTVTLDPGSSIFVHTISESDVTYSVTGNTYQVTTDTVTVQTENGVQVITDSSSNQVIQVIGDPAFIVAATGTSTLIQVYEGTVTLNDSSGNTVSIGQGYQSSIASNQAPTPPQPINDVTPPSVQSVFPTSSQSSINESMPVSVTFSKAIDPSSAAGLNFTVIASNGTLVNGEWRVLYQTVIFNPTRSTPAGTYTVQVKGGPDGVRDLSGNTLPSDYVFNFTVSAAWGPTTQGISSTGLPLLDYVIIGVVVAVVAIAAVVVLLRRRGRAPPRPAMPSSQPWQVAPPPPPPPPPPP